MDNSCCRNVGKISRSELLLLVFRYSRHKLFLITDIFLILEHLNSDCSVSSMGTGFWFNWMHIILHFSKSFDIRSFCSVLLPRVLWPKIWHLQYRPKKKKKKGIDEEESHWFQWRHTCYQELHRKTVIKPNLSYTNK